MSAEADSYGARHAVRLDAFKGRHADFACDGAWYADVLAAVQDDARTFAAECEATSSAVHRLENGLRVLGKALTPSSEETTSRIQALCSVRAALERIGDVAPFGSWVSGLHVPGGDLDLSLEGWLEWRFAGAAYRGYADDLSKGAKALALRYATELLRQYSVADGGVEQVLEARIPIIKFKHSGTGLACDLSIDGSGSLFKSALLGQLAACDWRVGALLRLVKAWARQQGINDASDGTLSSHALSLMVVWHLQMRSPAVLPPIRQLFAAGQRPLQTGWAPQFGLLQESGQWLRSMPHTQNSETLVELLASFFCIWHSLLSAWAASGEYRRLVASTWHGQYATNAARSFGTPLFSVEEPTNFADNVTRTVRTPERADMIVRAFERSQAHMREEMASDSGTESALQELFGDQLCSSSGTWDKLDADFQDPVPITPITVPNSIAHYVHSGSLPTPATVDHQQLR